MKKPSVSKRKATPKKEEPISVRCDLTINGRWLVRKDFLIEKRDRFLYLLLKEIVDNHDRLISLELDEEAKARKRRH